MFSKCFLLGMGLLAISMIADAQNRVVSSVVSSDARTGRLVRKTVVSRAGGGEALAAEPQQLKKLIDSIAEKNEIEPPLVHSVIRAESNYNPIAVSNKGAQGLMQLIPSTARRFGVKDSFDSEANLEGGVKYLKYLINLFHGDYERAIAAYNAGEAAVTKYGGVPPYRETRDYVAQVSRHLDAERRARIAALPAASAPTNDSTPSTETSNPVIASVTEDGKVFYRTP